MELMLEIISRHKFLPEIKPNYVFSEAGGYIGRSAESDWVLPDRAKRVSRRHALITCDGRDFYLEDLSSNGILKTLGKELVGKGGRYKINHGDSFQIGDYVLMARLLMSPETYAPPEMDASENIIPDDAFLDLDPVRALDQEDERAARRRLGFYDTLLDRPEPPGRVLSDHNEPRLDAMGPIRARPEGPLPPPPNGGGRAAGPPGGSWSAIELSIESLTRSIAAMTETLAVLERARDELKKAGLPQP